MGKLDYFMGALIRKWRQNMDVVKSDMIMEKAFI